MPRTVQEIVTEARGHLQDTVAPYRYTDADLVNYTNSAMRVIYRIRPDFFFGTYGTDIATLAIDDDYPLDFQTELPVVYFLVGSAMLRDDEFSVDARAVTMLKMFSNDLLRTATQ